MNKIVYSLILIVCPVFLHNVFGQVELEQGLNVKGKIKISDDSTPGTEGVLRYRSAVDDLEGYVDGQWKSLTKSTAPENPQPIVYAHFGVNNDGQWVPFDRSYDYTRSDPTDDLSNVEVPSGKIFVVDKFCVTMDSGTADSYFLASVRPTRRLSDGTQTNRNPQVTIGGSRKDGTTCIDAARAPIFVVKNRGSIAVQNREVSGGRVRVQVFGFYVDSLEDYFTY
ncbi:MAG: hypothetical protein AAFQ02_11990 [Bacteroidota bacterium]